MHSSCQRLLLCLKTGASQQAASRQARCSLLWQRPWLSNLLDPCVGDATLMMDAVRTGQLHMLRAGKRLCSHPQ